MGVFHFILQYVLRCLRFVLHRTTGFVNRLLSGPHEELPPLRDEILLHPATVLADRIRKREIRSVDLVKAVIRRAKDVNPFINAVVDDAYDDAIEAAMKIDDFVASGTKSPEDMKNETPLLGIPFSCKEYISAEGLYLTNGLVSRRGIRADEDAEVVKKMKAAGAIILGKTNVPELCMSWECGNKLYGITRNPYDTRRMSGGSSGGEGALIGSGASIIGLGSDLGGSLRIPSFMNGIFCHKPTAGVLPDVGTYPPLPESISHFYSNLGPMCRYASDLLPMMKILAPPEKLDLDKPVDFKQLTIYYAEDDGGNPLLTPVIPEIKASLKQAVRHFEKKHGVVSKRANLVGLQDSFVIWCHAVEEDGLPALGTVLNEGKGKFSLFWEFLKWCIGYSKHTLCLLFMDLMLKSVPEASSNSRKANLKKLKHLKAQFNNILKENCVFLYPTHPEPASYPHESMQKTLNIGYTAIFNALGYPVTQVPTGLCRGLPIGIQVVANSYNDVLPIAVAEELEKAFGGWTSPSPII